jgi:predicted RNase H-like HicB family nuclease
MPQLKVVVEKHADGYVAYPLGVEGVVIGQGDTCDDALADVKSALAFHIETFGTDVLDSQEPVLEVFVAEAAVVA